MLIFQSLKKWIYNNYDGLELDNLIVISDLNINQKEIIKKIIILDYNGKLIVPDNLNHLDINYNNYKIAENIILPDKLEILKLSGNYNFDLNNLPCNLISLELYLYNTNISLNFL